jgi:hypothetical protein
MSLLDTASLVVTPNGTKASKLYSVVPSSGAGDLSVTRATTATRVNSSGLIESVASNVPRLDYTNGTCPSILVEPQRTNLFTYSEDFTNASWLKTRATITGNATTAPDGTTTADLIADSTFTNSNSYTEKVVFSGLIGLAFSVYVKKNTANYISFGYYDIDFHGYVVNTNTWATTHTFGSPVSFKAENAGNGWYKLTMTKTASSVGVYASVAIQGTSNGANYDGTGALSAYFWGAQLEQGSYATSYIPTTSASVTRNADVISKTGISSLIGQTEGTLFYDGYFGNNNSEVYLFLQKSGSTIVDDSMYIQKQFGNQIRFNSFLSSTSQVAITGGSFSIGDRIKIAVGYKNNDFIMYINGVQIGTDTSGTPPTCANLHLATFAGDPTNEVYIANKSVNLTAFWKTRLTNVQLAQLTTI